MPISTIGQNGLTVPLTSNTITSAASTALTLQSAGTTAITVDTSQNVGIGGAATNEGGYARVLQVTGSTDCALELKTGSYYSYVAQNGTTLQIRNNATSGAMTFSTASTERLRITGNGGISQNGDWGTNASTALRNNSAAANKFWQSGPDSNNAYIVYNQAGNGVYVVDGGTSWAGLSDERLKDIIEPIENGLTKVASLRAVIGKFKTDAEGTRRSFLIAQDVQSILPEAISSTKVQGDETEYLGVSYTDVIPLLVASIKELKTIVDAQAAEIAELKAKVA